MPVREIAARFEHKCDGCGLVKDSPSKSRPSHWTGLNIAADAYDFQGAAVADASVARLLCPTCTRTVHKAINDAISVARTALSTTPQSMETPQGGAAA